MKETRPRSRGHTVPIKPPPASPPGWSFSVVGSMLGGIGVALVVSASVFQIGKGTGIPGFIFLFVGIALLIVYFIAEDKKVTAED